MVVSMKYSTVYFFKIHAGCTQRVTHFVREPTALQRNLEMLVNGLQDEGEVLKAPLGANSNELTVSGVDEQFMKARSVSHLFSQLMSSAITDATRVISKLLKYLLNFG